MVARAAGRAAGHLECPLVKQRRRGRSVGAARCGWREWTTLFRGVHIRSGPQQPTALLEPGKANCHESESGDLDAPSAYCLVIRAAGHSPRHLHPNTTRAPCLGGWREDAPKHLRSTRIERGRAKWSPAPPLVARQPYRTIVCAARGEVRSAAAEEPCELEGGEGEAKMVSVCHEAEAAWLPLLLCILLLHAAHQRVRSPLRP